MSSDQEPITAAPAEAAAPRVLPPLYAYTKEFQALAAQEADPLAQRPCARQDSAPVGCSALRTILADYKTVRDRIRTLGGQPE